uniref:Uncharacterized protein n=1 Tax=Cryptomonas curvata TaxID=233186 RepID=A0A7S0MLN2_9CRYP
MMAETKKRKLEETYLSLEEMNKAKELLLDKTKTEQKIAAQVVKDLTEVESLVRSEMERNPPLWTDSEFEKLGIRAAVEGIYKAGKFDPEILQKAERLAVPLLVTFCNRLPKAAVKPSKKEPPPEEKKPPSSTAAASRAPSSSAKAGSNKELSERIERLEDAYRRLEKRVERLAAKSS